MPRPHHSAADAADKLEAVASKKAGLLGVSELSNDMRDLREAIKDGNAKARLAVDKFTWTIAEVDRQLRRRTQRPRHAGLHRRHRRERHRHRALKSAPASAPSASSSIPTRNNVRGEAIISAENSPVTVRVIPPLEDLIIVNHVVRLLAA